MEQHRINKLCQKYCKYLSITEEQFHRGLQTPGVVVYPNHIEFKFDKIIAKSEFTASKNFSTTLSNFKVIASNVFDIDCTKLYTNGIWPHSGSRHCAKIGRKSYRKFCAGYNLTQLSKLINKFQLQEFKFLAEDIISKISGGGYWYPSSDYEKDANLIFSECKICTKPLIDSELCEACVRICTSLNLDVKKTDRCLGCGNFKNKHKRCHKCHQQK